MGLPSAAALGLITGVLNIIPVIGPWLGGALAGITGIFISPAHLHHRDRLHRYRATGCLYFHLAKAHV